jgi:ribosomal protein S18 acetylase RimI-like enzyme
LKRRYPVGINPNLIPECTNQGIRKAMLESAVNIAKVNGYRELIIGTPASAEKQLAIYQRAGFVSIETRKDLFVQNYIKATFEDGVQLRDMVILKKSLN